MMEEIGVVGEKKLLGWKNCIKNSNQKMDKKIWLICD